MEAFCGHVFEPSIFVGILHVISFTLVGGSQGVGGICFICFQVTEAKTYLRLKKYLRSVCYSIEQG